MENQERTASYLALIERRREGLQTEFARILPPGAAFTWEVGSGHGHFLTAYAQANPDKLCIGIDLVGERIERALRKRDRARLPNLHFIRAEAGFFLRMLPPGVRLAEIFILFPDPWPKLRHRKHRIVQPAFLAAAGSRTEKNAPLYFRTDFQPYFDDALAVVAADTGWRLVDDPWPFEFQTVFQRRAPAFRSLIARSSA